MPSEHRRRSYLNLIFLFVVIRIVLNLFALSNYGFQRDEMLHLAVGDHLAWGFKEVPPFIAFIARLSVVLFGHSIAAVRVFTTLASGLIILLTGLITIEFGGKKFAITLACLALTFSPAFLASGYLLQPVVFDQLWWLLSVYLLIKYTNTRQNKYLYYLGCAIGLGLLTKYTMAFFTLALVIGILFGGHRKILFSKPVLISALIAFLIFLPNIIWQLTHHLPLVTHMSQLRSTQLDYIKPSDFLIQQLQVNGAALFLWLVGLIALLFSKQLSPYRFVAIAYLFTLVLFLVLKGKIYYLFGAYPMLFAAGGVAFNQLIKPNLTAVRVATLLLFTVPNLVLLPLVLPVVPIKSALPLFGAIANAGFKFIFIWEDHRQHPLTQDYADMLGWDELAKKVAGIYHGLTPDQQKQTVIFADNYGEAGAIHLYGRFYGLPEVISLNSSFTLWAPANLKAKYIIYIDGGNNGEKLLKALCIGNYQVMGQIENPLAREHGTVISLMTDLKPALNLRYQKDLAERLDQ